MSDPALRRPPFIPEGTFRCCHCFDVFPESEAWEGELYGEHGIWDCCVPCQESDLFMGVLLIMTGGNR